MIIRDKNYRRKQEAKHYKKRVSISLAKNRLREITDNDGNVKVVPNYGNKNKVWTLYTQRELSTYEKEMQQKAVYKKWKFQLKNDSLPGTIDTWAKRHCRRTRRHFQKMVDYKLPDKKWLVRAQVIYPRDIV